MTNPDGLDKAATEGPGPGKRRRWLRFLLWTLASLVLLLAIASAALIHILSKLDTPDYRQRVTSLVKESLGMDMDYSRLEVSLLRGVVIENLVVRQPQRFRAVAPDLLRVGKIILSYRAWGLSPSHLQLQNIEVEGLEAHLVSDETGATSISELMGAIPSSPEAEVEAEPPGPPVPLARLLELQGLPLSIGLDKVILSGADLSLHQIQAGAVVATTRVEGLSLALHDIQVKEGDLGAGMILETKGDATTITLERGKGEGKRTQSLRLMLRQSLLVWGSRGLKGELALQLLDQDIDQRLDYRGQMADVKLKVQMDPENDSVALEMPTLSLLGGALQGALSLEVGEELGQATRLVQPVVHQASLRLDLDQALSLAGLVMDTSAITIKEGHIELLIQGLEPDLIELGFKRGRVDLKARVGRLKAALGPGAANLRGLALDLGVEIKGPRELAVAGKIRADKLSLAGAVVAKVEKASVDINVSDLKADLVDPKATTGQVRLEVRLGRAEARAGEVHIRGEGLGLAMETTLAGGPPFSGSLTMPLDRLEVIRQGKALVDIKGGEIKLVGTDLHPHLSVPAQSKGSLLLVARLGEVQAKVELRRGSGLDAFEADLDMASLALVQALVPSAALRQVGQVPWKRVGLKVHTKGQARLDALPDLGRMNLTQSTTVTIKGLSLIREGLRVSSPLVSLDLASQGGQRQELEVKLLARGLRLNEYRAKGNMGLTGKVALELGRPKLAFTLDTLPGMAPQLGLTLDARVAQPSMAVTYELGVKASQLAELVRMLGLEEGELAFSTKGLDLKVSSKGEARGLVAQINRGLPALVKDPLRTLTLVQQTNMEIHDLVTRGRTRLEMPLARMNLKSKGSLGTLDAQADLSLPELVMVRGQDRVHIRDMAQTVEVSTSDWPGKGRMDMAFQGRVGEAKQNIVPEVNVGGLEVRGQVEVLGEERVRVRAFRLRNEESGTEVELDASVDQRRSYEGQEGARSISVKGRVVQILDRIGQGSLGIRTRGRVEVPFTLVSTGLRRFELSSQLKMDKVYLEMERMGLKVVNFTGLVALVEEVSLSPEGKVSLVPVVYRNPYARATFADVHPFLQDGSFFSLERVEYKGWSVGPIAGNLSVNRNLFNLYQVQFNLGGGKVYGQMALDYEKGNSILLFRGKLTDIRSTTGGSERFDANAAIDINLNKLLMEGRIHVVQIGRQHLLDLLDMIDPYREDSRLNKARMGLKVGYPKFVRLRMEEGLLSLKLELGGVASLVKIDEFRGIAMGPFLNRYVAPLLPWSK